VLYGDKIAVPRALSTLWALRCSQIGRIAMRLLSKKQVKNMVLYSLTHIDRLEKAGKFPKKVRLGVNRIGYVESEVIEWLEERVCQRDNSIDTP
jgi:prophage regulatory protein